MSPGSSHSCLPHSATHTHVGYLSPTAPMPGGKRLRQTRLLWAWLLLGFVAGLPALDRPLRAEAPAPAIAKPADPGIAALRRYRDSGKYAQDVAQAAELARVRLREKLRDLPAGARPVIVSDIDETVLASWTSVTDEDFIWQPERFDRRARSGMQGLAPMVALYRQAREMGVAIIFVTARSDTLAEATAQNLATVGLGDYARLILKPAGAPDDFKAEERRKIRESGYTVLLYLGDQPGDLSGKAEDDILIPNPFYTL